MSKKISTKPLSGMRDFLADDVARRQYVIDRIRSVYQRYGFVPLETPSLESLAVLLDKYGPEGDQLLYRVLHRRDALKRVLAQEKIVEAELSDEGLRYDLTVPLARVVAQYGQLPKYYKRYQIQPVWRADRPGKARFREFYQCDVDITGIAGPLAEAEICAAATEALQALGFHKLELQINHRALLRAMIRAVGINANFESTALIAVDKLDKIGIDGVLQELQERGIHAQHGKLLLALVHCESFLQDTGTTHELLIPAERVRWQQCKQTILSRATESLTTKPHVMVAAFLRELLHDEEGQTAIDELLELFNLLETTPAGPWIHFCPYLARGLGYYTGTIFEIRVADLDLSIAGGGRYDNLIGIFANKQVPAVGLSLGLERILVVMQEQGMFPPLVMGSEILLCSLDVELSQVLKVAHQLRSQNLRVEIFPEVGKKLSKQLQYADSPAVNIPFAGILGRDEIEKAQITLKHLPTGKQIQIPIEETAQTIRSLDGIPK